MAPAVGDADVASLREALRTAQAELAESERRLGLLRRAAVALFSSLDYHETLQHAANLTVPELADWCAVDVLEGDTLRRLAIAHVDPEQIRLARELGERYPTVSAGSVVAQVIEHGEPVLANDIDDDLIRAVTRDEEHFRMLQQLGMRAALVVPMTARGRRLGAITLVSTTQDRRYDQQDLEIAMELAGRAAVAVDNALLHAAAQEALADSERVQASRARLVRGFSHDLKNPLGAADGYAQLLLDGLKGELQPGQRQAIERMRVSLRAALDLIDVLVELARTEAGQLELRPTSFDARGVIAEVVGEFAAQADAAGLQLVCDVPDDGIRVLTDRHRVRQILANLLSNAVKYTPEGTITVRLHQRDDGAPGVVCFDVIDTGPGIPEDQQDVVFREFTRLEHGKQGAGLGLAISRRIANLLGGDILLQSRPGAGSTFSLELPAEG